MSGTENVVHFCYTEKIKRLHYISTAYVAGKRRDVVYEDELDKGQSFNNNYEKSKFDTEKLLNQVVRQYDVPTTVYRPSIIVGDSRTGYTKITITFIFSERDFTTSKITKHKSPMRMISQLTQNAYINLRI